MIRKLTEKEKLAMKNLEVLGYCFDHTGHLTRYDTPGSPNTITPTSRMIRQYAVMVYSKAEWHYYRNTGTPFRERAQLIYILPNGQVTKHYDIAQKIVFDQLKLGNIEKEKK